MESIPENCLLKFNSDTMISIRKLYNLDKPGDMDKAIDLLDDWIKKQNHFTKKDYSRDFLERSIIMLKGSIERSKMQMEKLCTLRTIIPSHFDKHDPKNDFKELRKFFIHALLPKLTKDNYRVYTGRFIRDGINSKTFYDCYRFSTLYCEYIKAHDYCNGFVAIMDYRDINLLELLSSINPFEFNQFITMLMKGYGMRIKGIHLLTPSKTVEIVIKMFGKMFGPKVSKRIHVHPTLDTLYDHVPRDILPVEYGGYEKSVLELNDEWTECLSLHENIKYTKELGKAVVVEAYRQTDKFNEMYHGVAGTFRTLNVD